MKAIAKTHFFTAYSASAKKFFERLWNAAWPQPLRKASGFPELVRILAAMPLLRQTSNYGAATAESQRLSAKAAAKPHCRNNPQLPDPGM